MHGELLLQNLRSMCKGHTHSASHLCAIAEAADRIEQLIEKEKTPMKWWKPIETGGLYSCKDCPQSVLNRPEVADLEGTIRALEFQIVNLKMDIDRFSIEFDKATKTIEMWRKVADGFAEAGTHPTAHDMAMEDYEEAVQNELMI
jgi:hypothetical protein